MHQMNPISIQHQEDSVPGDQWPLATQEADGAHWGHQDSNALHKHQMQKHPDQAPEFRSKSLKGDIKYNLDRVHS